MLDTLDALDGEAGEASEHMNYIVGSFPLWKRSCSTSHLVTILLSKSLSIRHTVSRAFISTSQKLLALYPRNLGWGRNSMQANIFNTIFQARIMI